MSAATACWPCPLPGLRGGAARSLNPICHGRAYRERRPCLSRPARRANDAQRYVRADFLVYSQQSVGPDWHL
jgi:hypothetical protein